MSRRVFLLAFLVAALLVAGVGSYHASGDPDGLERVAERAGFADSAEESAASESPLSGYDTDGVGNERLSGGVAGVAGALVVLVLAGGLAYAVRRRGSLPDTRADTHADSAGDR